VCSIIFGLLIWATSHSTALLVGAELTRFMAERTSRGCIHGWNTSVVTYGYVMETLEADIQTARLLLAKDGGAHHNNGLHYQSAPLPLSPEELGWKDIVQCPPGIVTRIIVKFDGYAGRYLYHCHVLEHEANDMMRPFDVVDEVCCATDAWRSRGDTIQGDLR